MIGLLQPNERLVHAGQTALRAPDGTPLENVPQYMIVPADEADPASVVELKDSECLVVAGTVHNARKAAEDRFAAAKVGHACPCADGTLLYIKDAASYVDKRTGLSAGEEKACEALVGDMLAAFAIYERRLRAQNKKHEG